MLRGWREQVEWRLLGAGTQGGQLFKPFEEGLGAADGGAGQVCELGDLDALALVRRAVRCADAGEDPGGLANVPGSASMP